MKEEIFFNINTMLKNVFQSLDQECNIESVNLIFIFSKTVPCQMKGDVTTLYTVLLNILREVMKHDCISEILISVDAPEEFFYDEPVTFKITNIPLRKEKILPLLKKNLLKDIEKMDATFEYSEENGGSLVLTVPLTTAELGCRRHYRNAIKNHVK